MASKTQVSFHFVGDSTQFQREALKAQKALERTGTIAEKSSKQASGGYTKLKAALAGAGIIAFAQKSAVAFLQEQVATTKLQNTLKNNPQLAHASEKGFEDLAKSISYKTAADKESVLSGIAVLGNFKLNEQQIRTLTPVVVDFARKTGRDVPEAAGLIGKALLGNARALKTVGIAFKPTGDAAKDYGTILADLKGKVGGYADAEEKSRHGIDVMQHRFHELQVEVGGKVLSAFDFLVRNFKVLGPLIIAIGAAIATVKIAQFAKELGAALTAIRSGTGTAIQKALTIIGNLGPVLGGVGIALAAGVGAWALWNKGQSDAKALAHTYLDALKQERDGLRGVSDALLINNLQQSGALKIARDLGITGSDLIGYLHGQADATNRVTVAASKQVGVMNLGVVGISTFTGKGADLISALGTQRDAYNTATQALGDVNTALATTAVVTKTATTRILGMTQVDFKTWATGLRTSLNFVSNDLTKLGGNAKLSAKDVLKAFTDELTAMTQYRHNFDTLLARHAPADLLKQLADMGEQGAPIIAALAKANNTQFDAIVAKWNAARRAAPGVVRDIGVAFKKAGPIKIPIVLGVPHSKKNLADFRNNLRDLAEGGLPVSVKATPTFNTPQVVVHAQSVSVGKGFAEGGPVPGPVGKAQLAVVHGGEYVLSHRMLTALKTAKRSGSDGTAALATDNSDILGELRALRRAISSMSIVMDSEKVGRIASRQIGQRADLIARGG